jgi:2'-5' RNA ligase
MSNARATVRTFICVDLPETLKERIDMLEGSLRKIDAQVSWVRAANVHLTIKFLGEVGLSRLEHVVEVVHSAAAAVTPFELELGSTGCFPSQRNPRVLWVGLAETPRGMTDLYESIENGLAAHGFPREAKSFNPHLTIGRVRSPRNGQLLAEKLIQTGFVAERFTVREVIVMRSDLSPAGSIYTSLSVARLGQATSLG